MAKVFIPAVLRSFTGGAATADASGSTVREVVADLVRQFPALDGHVIDAEGQRPEIMIAVGADEIFSIDQVVPQDAEVHILPALAGGEV